MRELRTEQEIMSSWKGDINSPIVSVCCNTYNHEKYISEALDSFLMQETNFPFEIIVRDDASPDKTAEIIREYEAKYPNIIKPIYEKENGYQKGIKPSPVTFAKSIGEYIAFCEGDDYWTDKKKLQIQKDFLESNPEYIICYTDVEAFNENGIIQDYIGGATKDLTADELKKATPINTLTTMYRNIMKDKFSAEFNASKYGDLFIWSILGYYGKGKYLPQIKPARYRVHSGGVHSGSSQIDKYDNTLITYALLLSYHKKLGSSHIVEYFRQEILWLLLRNNFKNFLVSFLIRVKNKILRWLKNDRKN